MRPCRCMQFVPRAVFWRLRWPYEVSVTLCVQLQCWVSSLWISGWVYLQIGEDCIWHKRCCIIAREWTISYVGYVWIKNAEYEDWTVAWLYWNCMWILISPLKLCWKTNFVYMAMWEIRCSMAHVKTVDDVICYILRAAHIVNTRSWLCHVYMNNRHDKDVTNKTDH